MHRIVLIFSALLIINYTAYSQPTSLTDDFEGNGNINWVGDGCIIDPNLSNPVAQGINSSATVLKYHDVGGQFANVRFDAGFTLNMANSYIFTLKIYVPSASITGTQPNQIALKLQNGALPAPWTTQTEIIKPLALDQWQELTFDFKNDPYVNINPTSPAPIQRGDLNRVLIQLNGENNNDSVLAYIDDFVYIDSTPPPPTFNYLVWSDEFNGTGAIDGNKWWHQTQLPPGGSWYNNEIQHYTNRLDNSYVDNGSLTIVAKKETFTDQGYTKQYTSARLNSKFAFTYGRVEVMAKLPTGAGTWPAIWMLGKNINEDGAFWDLQGFGTTPWPACGEIDIMEHWGNNQNFVQSATHTPSSHGATINHGGQTIPTVSNNYHLYALEWSSEQLVFSVDSVVHFVYNPIIKNDSTWPFYEEQYFILNIAIEPSIDPAFTESTMDIDYIRVYQENPSSISNIKHDQKAYCYPNPANSRLNIYLENGREEAAVVEIYDINGRVMTRQSSLPVNNQIEINNLSKLKNGMYIVNVRQGNEVHRLKFIKE